eukprot:3184223-Heterocapsa_arctica.AAC.1
MAVVYHRTRHTGPQGGHPQELLNILQQAALLDAAILLRREEVLRGLLIEEQGLQLLVPVVDGRGSWRMLNNKSPLDKSEKLTSPCICCSPVANEAGEGEAGTLGRAMGLSLYGE